MSAQVSHNLHRLIVTQNDPLVRQGVSISYRATPFDRQLNAMRETLSAEEIAAFEGAKCSAIALIAMKYEHGLEKPCRDIPADVQDFIASVHTDASVASVTAPAEAQPVTM